MKKCILIFTIIFLITFTSSLAADPNVFLTLSDTITQELIDDLFVTINNKGEDTRYFLEKDETLKLFFEKGPYSITIVADNPQTEGPDYHGTTILDVDQKIVKVVQLYPVGSLNGLVKDKLDNVISGASLKFECNKVIPLRYPSETDNFGSFSLEVVPTGRCKVFGNYKGSVGVQEVTIKKGERTAIDIKLDTILVRNQGNNYGSFIPVIVIIFIIAAAILFLGKKRRKHKSETKQKVKREIRKETNSKVTKEEKIADSSRTNDLLKTLRDNEKKVVEFLLEQKDPIHLSKIHHKTGMSKGSLFRNIRSLERKNIVETSSEGRIKKVKLTPWFLGE